MQYPHINHKEDSLLNVFKAKQKTFNAPFKEAIVKEEQQALFLKADTISQKGDFFEAIRIYNKAIEMDELAYPLAYANVALLYAHINYFDYALFNMQKYLLLETNATAIRGAKDKIYEWKALIHY